MELQNSAAFKSYPILRFGNLVGFLIKKGRKIWIFSYFTFFWTTFAFWVEFNWNLGQSIYTCRQKIWSIFFKNIVNFWFYATIVRKNSEKLRFSVFFCNFFMQNWHNIKGWQYFWKKTTQDFLPKSVDDLLQILAKLDSKFKSSSEKHEIS